MKNMVYIQSGGPTSVINTSLYGAIKEAKKHPDQIGHIYGCHSFSLRRTSPSVVSGPMMKVRMSISSSRRTVASP